MNRFITDEFLLHSASAVSLYENYAKQCPILDYHCHLNPKDIAENRKFRNITEAWLSGDHYKWRAMRANGIPEEFITGYATDEEKFQKWAETVPMTLRNPLYHWTHLELARYFDIHQLLMPETAREIYRQTTELLQDDAFSVQNLLLKMNVKVVCTTDDPLDSLESHRFIQEHPFGVKVLPAWRPDKAMTPENTAVYNDYLDRLSELTGIEIIRFDDLLAALKVRHDYFHSMGCRISDHGLDKYYSLDFTEAEIRIIFGKIRSKITPDRKDTAMFKSAMLCYLAGMNHEKGWVQQFHVGAMRNNNSLMFKKLGPDCGFDSIGKTTDPNKMARFLDKLSNSNILAKTILYNLNPADNALYATMTGNFQDGITPGKIQWGAAWWFLDQKNGMEEHIETLSVFGLLSRFVGMLTDSRSFLSFPRHEYFRRILCNILGRDMENGEIPMDMEMAGNLVSGICFTNAKNYFTFEI